MPKGTSKVMFFCSKWRHGPPMFDLSSDFWRFGVMPKNDDFGMPSRWSKKSEKSTIFVQDVFAVTRINVGQQGPQGCTLFAHEKLREKIQGKKKDLTRPRPEARRVSFDIYIKIYQAIYWAQGSPGLPGQSGQFSRVVVRAPVQKSTTSYFRSKQFIFQFLKPPGRILFWRF